MKQFALLALILLSSVSPYAIDSLVMAAEESGSLQFTPQEKEYIQKTKEIPYCTDPDFMPLEQINKAGKHEGIFADFVTLIARKSGLGFILVPTKSYVESREKFDKGECVIIAADAVPMEGSFTFTKAYFITRGGIAVRKDENITSVKDLRYKNVGYIEGVDAKFLENRYGGSNLVPLSNTIEGLKKVANGELFGHLDLVPTIIYGIEKNGLISLKLLGDVDHEVKFGMHIKNEFKELTPIINKTIRSITNEERQTITKKWLNITLEKKVDYSLLWKILLVLGTFIAIFAYRQFILSRVNKELTVAKNEAEKARKIADEANQTKSIFLTNMSHELRTPLNAILGYAQIFKRDKSLTVKQLEGIDIMQQSGEHLLSLINDILDLSKVESGKVEVKQIPFDLNKTVNDINNIHKPWHTSGNNVATC